MTEPLSHLVGMKWELKQSEHHLNHSDEYCASLLVFDDKTNQFTMMRPIDEKLVTYTYDKDGWHMTLKMQFHGSGDTGTIQQSIPKDYGHGSGRPPVKGGTETHELYVTLGLDKLTYVPAGTRQDKQLFAGLIFALLFLALLMYLNE